MPRIRSVLNIAMHPSTNNMYIYIYILLCRNWAYDEKVSEYYVITDDTRKHVKADTTREVEETRLKAPWPYCLIIYIYICIYTHVYIF